MLETLVMLLAVRSIQNPVGLSGIWVKICAFCFISKPNRKKKEQNEFCLFQLYCEGERKAKRLRGPGAQEGKGKGPEQGRGEEGGDQLDLGEGLRCYFHALRV